MSARRHPRSADAARARFGAAWRATLLAVLRDKGVLLILLAAPVVYGFFYPWPYSTQAVTRVPVALVDQDNSGLSRQIARFAAADPHLQLVRITANELEARQLLWQGRIEGYALLPPDLRRHVLRGEPAVVPIEGNGAYTLLNKAVLTGFSQAVGTVSAGVEIRKLQARGLGPTQAAAARSPLNLQAAALFNPTEGYGSYVVPAVALLILQQALLMGAAMLVGGWAEARQLRATPAAWLGRVVGLSCIGLASGAFYFGWVFFLQDDPRGGNPPAAALLLLLYVPAVCALGLVIGLLVRDRERALQVLLFTALPMFFLSGVPWPDEALPPLLQALRWLIPSTLGIQASLRVNQMGAPLADVWMYLAALALQCAVSVGVLVVLARRPAPRPPGPAVPVR